MKFKFFVLIILFSAISCGTMKYDYLKISNFEQKKSFQVFNNSEKINSNNIIFDKNNIDKVLINRNQKKINIISKNKPELITFKEIFDSQSDKNVNIFSVYGLPFFKENFENTKVEKSGIDSINIIKIPLSCKNSSALVIKMKN